MEQSAPEVNLNFNTGENTVWYLNTFKFYQLFVVVIVFF